MTIKELYEEAVRLGREDWDITVYDYDGETRTADDVDWEEEHEEVFIS